MNFNETFEYRRDPPPLLTVIIAADGFGPTRLRIPVAILEQEEYTEYTEQRAVAYAAANPELFEQHDAEEAS